MALQDLRKMTPEQRKELLSSIEKEEQLEQEALKQNPNLTLERQLKQVVSELKDIRQQITSITYHYDIGNIRCRKLMPDTYIEPNLDEQNSVDECNDCSFFSMDMLPLWIFLLFVIISLFTPSKPSIRPFSI
jgi:hypothetical protein